MRMFIVAMIVSMGLVGCNNAPKVVPVVVPSKCECKRDACTQTVNCPCLSCCCVCNPEKK